MNQIKLDTTNSNSNVNNASSTTALNTSNNSGTAAISRSSAQPQPPLANSLSSNWPEEEFKTVLSSGNNQSSSSQIKLQCQRAKETIRKLPMFETYDDGVGDYDFEWPPKSQLK